MIGIFRRNLFVNSLLLFPYTLLLRIHSLIYPVAQEPGADKTMIMNGLLDVFSSGFWQNILACLLIFLQAVMINRMSIQHRISRHLTLLPGVFYIILMSFLPEYSFLSSYLVANTFFILALSEFMKVYLKSHRISNIFNSGALIALGISIAPTYGLLLIFGVLAVIVLNALNILNVLQYIGGVLSMLLLICGTQYLINSDPWIDLSLMIPSVQQSIWKLYSLDNRLFILVIALILLAVIGYNTYNVKKSINAQRKIDMLYFFLLFALIPYFLIFDIHPERVLPMFIPLSIFAAMSFLDIRNNIIAEFIHLLILAGLFMLNFGIVLG